LTAIYTENLTSSDPDTRDLIEPGHRLRERGDLLIDPGLHHVNVSGNCVHPGQHGPQQERVMLGEPPSERLLQAAGLTAHRPARQLGQDLRVTLTGDQRRHHVPPGHPEHVTNHDRHLDQRVLQELFHPLLLRRPGGDQVYPVPGEIT
jgi:hypothetical protein